MPLPTFSTSLYGHIHQNMPAAIVLSAVGQWLDKTTSVVLQDAHDDLWIDREYRGMRLGTTWNLIRAETQDRMSFAVTLQLDEADAAWIDPADANWIGAGGVRPLFDYDDEGEEMGGVWLPPLLDTEE